MQYFKLSAFVALALATFAAATPISANNPPPVDQCNTGAAQCCQTTQESDSTSGLALLALLGIALQGVTGLIGSTCSPITGIGLSGTSCSQQPVCCTNDTFNGVIALGCTPININA
ncbi:hypothetical protein HYPSUDRAFT_151246 [Hypholoma sublateritium FD-334 SS-4]|uniref:Hydrophobin n=1 Tax=Hypholoma sublateritium (strain FD-334 SS-4) TaxID=945553 RepID=A0A0D2NZ82_HYPSF|nr:hypothetical protein HYPSUDRAFT_151246 [Hypholoma sublateritium FD-334 SS-4]